MAARTRDARARRHLSRTGRASSNASRGQSRKSHGRCGRTAPLHNPTASPLTSLPTHTLLRNVPQRILVGDVLNDARLGILMRLIDAGTIPSLTPRVDETTGNYIRRALQEMATQYRSIPHRLTIERSNGSASVFLATFRIDGRHDYVNAIPFLENVPAVVGANLLAGLEEASGTTFDIFGPQRALWTAEMLHYGNGPEEFWNEVRIDLATDRHIDEATITPQQLRQHIRTAGIRTPGYFQRVIGAAHARRQRTAANRLTPEQCLDRVAHLDKQQQAAIESMVTAIDVLANAAKVLDKRQQLQCDLVADVFENSPEPGLIIETSRDQTVGELIEELWQYEAQSEGFGANYAMVLYNDRESPQRLNAVLTAFDQATNAVNLFRNALESFEAFDTKRPQRHK